MGFMDRFSMDSERRRERRAIALPGASYMKGNVGMDTSEKEKQDQLHRIQKRSNSGISKLEGNCPTAITIFNVSTSLECMVTMTSCRCVPPPSLLRRENIE